MNQSRREFLAGAWMMAAASAAAGFASCAAAHDVAKWDPKMAAEFAVVTNGVKWLDGKTLPIEGRAFDDVEHWYDRLPANVTTNVNGGVRWMKHHTSGMQFRFKTDSSRLQFRWTPFEMPLALYHMPATAKSGIDVYRWDEAKGRWFHAATGRIDEKKGCTLSVEWKPGTPCIVNLPLYNGVRDFSLGIDLEAKVEPLTPRKSGVTKPVVFYGTSITQGGCASRPGLAYVNRIGRELDVPVVNLGFSGSGRMELEMADHLARIDASCYVLDCLGNMSRPNRDKDAAFHDMYAAGFDENDPISVLRFRYEPFIRALRAKRPDVPIVMSEHCEKSYNAPKMNDLFVRELFGKLVAEGWTRLVHLPKDGMLPADGEGTVDGGHPNDIGMESMARAYGRAVREALLSRSCQSP